MSLSSDLPDSPTPSSHLHAPAGTASPGLPAQPFTLWLDPASWPRPSLRLPGLAFTLWTNPDTWPAPPLRLPARGFTLWLDPDNWPAPQLRLPGQGFTVWLDPARWPSVSESPAAPAIPTTPPAMDQPAITPPPSASAPIVLKEARGFTLWLPTAPAAPVIAPAAAATTPAAPRLRLPGQAFTLWTRPERVQAITMRNASGSEPQAAPVSAGAPRPIQWLPAAAGLAIAGVVALMYASADAARRGAESAALAAQAEARSATVAVDLEKTKALAFERRLTEKEAEITAKQADATSAAAELKKQITAAEEAAKKANALVQEKSTALAAAEKALTEARKEASSRETTLQGNLTALTEELSKVKRVAGEELTKAKEAAGKLEAEKAALVRDAATTAAERDVLKAEVEKLRRQLQSAPKPPGGPEA